MGRGRAKAKQQKVARDLKYNTHFTDLDALQRELGVHEAPAERSTDSGADDADDSDDIAGSHAAYDDQYEDWTGTDR